MNIDQRIDTLEQRLSAMERKSRAWRILALLLLVALIGGAASEGVFDNASWAADEKAAKEKVTKFDVVEAKTLRIRADNGVKVCEITTTHGVISKFDLWDPRPKGEPAGISMSVFSPKGGSTSNMSVYGSSAAISGISVGNKRGVTSITGDEVKMVPKSLSRELSDLMKKYVEQNSGGLSKAEESRLNKLLNHAAYVEMTLRPTGGRLVLRNQFLHPVVDIQSNRTNQGGVYVNDVNGELVRSLSAP